MKRHGTVKAAILAVLATGPKTSREVAEATGESNNLTCVLLDTYRRQGDIQSRRTGARFNLWALNGWEWAVAAEPEPAQPEPTRARAFAPPAPAPRAPYSMRGVIP